MHLCDSKLKVCQWIEAWVYRKGQKVMQNLSLIFRISLTAGTITKLYEYEHLVFLLSYVKEVLNISSDRKSEVRVNL